MKISAAAKSAAKSDTAAARKRRMLMTLTCTDEYESAARAAGARCIAGVDEVGRGALFGPVVAAAVILPAEMEELLAAGLKDSKQLKVEARERMAAMVRECALCISIAEVDAATIDRINIYQATRLAMRLAVEQLQMQPDHLLIDAMRIEHTCAQTKIVYGDALCLSIAAASVVAKVYRDGMMREMDAVYPVYGLAAHKGYGTAKHRKAIEEHGPCELHRKSFALLRAGRT
jgi:ribonuclease HII